MANTTKYSTLAFIRRQIADLQELKSEVSCLLVKVLKGKVSASSIVASCEQLLTRNINILSQTENCLEQYDNYESKQLSPRNRPDDRASRKQIDQFTNSCISSGHPLTDHASGKEIYSADAKSELKQSHKLPADHSRTPKITDFGISDATLRMLDGYRSSKDVAANSANEGPKMTSASASSNQFSQKSDWSGGETPAIFKHEGFLVSPNLMPGITQDRSPPPPGSHQRSFLEQDPSPMHKVEEVIPIQRLHLTSDSSEDARSHSVSSMGSDNLPDSTPEPPILLTPGIKQIRRAQPQTELDPGGSTPEPPVFQTPGLEPIRSCLKKDKNMMPPPPVPLSFGDCDNTPEPPELTFNYGTLFNSNSILPPKNQNLQNKNSDDIEIKSIIKSVPLHSQVLYNQPDISTQFESPTFPVEKPRLISQEGDSVTPEFPDLTMTYPGINHIRKNPLKELVQNTTEVKNEDTPEPPTFLTPGFKLFKESRHLVGSGQQMDEKCPASDDNTPEPPTFMTPGIKICPKQTNRNSENLEVCSDVKYDTPEPPILQTPGLKQFNRKKALGNPDDVEKWPLSDKITHDINALCTPGIRLEHSTMVDSVVQKAFSPLPTFSGYDASNQTPEAPVLSCISLTSVPSVNIPDTKLNHTYSINQNATFVEEMSQNPPGLFENHNFTNNSSMFDLETTLESLNVLQDQTFDGRLEQSVVFQSCPDSFINESSASESVLLQTPKYQNKPLFDASVTPQMPELTGKYDFSFNPVKVEANKENKSPNVQNSTFVIEGKNSSSSKISASEQRESDLTEYKWKYIPALTEEEYMSQPDYMRHIMQLNTINRSVMKLDKLLTDRIVQGIQESVVSDADVRGDLESSQISVLFLCLLRLGRLKSKRRSHGLKYYCIP